jgi:hypothetical protein
MERGAQAESKSPAPSTCRASLDLPDRHPDRMIAAWIVLYVGLGIIIAVTAWNHWKSGHP